MTDKLAILYIVTLLTKSTPGPYHWQINFIAIEIHVAVDRLLDLQLSMQNIFIELTINTLYYIAATKG